MAKLTVTFDVPDEIVPTMNENDIKYLFKDALYEFARRPGKGDEGEDLPARLKAQGYVDVRYKKDNLLPSR